jgi:O-antigen/teichoic acid export membrane protein
LARVVSFAQLVLLTKYLGLEGFGVWSLVQAIPGMLLVLTDMGMNTIMLRAIARDKTQERDLLQRVLSLKFFLAPVYVFAVYLMALGSGHNRYVVYLTTLYALAIVANLCGDSLIAVWRAHERFGLEAKITFARDVAISSLLIAVTALGWGLEGLIAVSILHGLVVSTVLLRRYLKQKPLSWVVCSPRDYLTEIRSATPFAVYGMLSPLSAGIALVMLGWLSDLSSVGVYNAAFRVVVFLYFIPNALQRTLLPRLSLQYRSSRVDYPETFDKALRLVLLISIPAAVGLTLTAQDVVALLFADQYAISGPVLALLALSVPVYYVRVVMNAGLYAANREKLSLLVVAAVTAVNGLLNWLLIPRFGCVGAALSTVTVEGTLCCAFGCLMAKDYAFKRVLGFTSKVFLASSLMALVVWYSGHFPLALKVPLGAAVYAAALWGLKLIDPRLLLRYRLPGQQSEGRPL